MPQEIERKFLVNQLPEEIQSAKALPIEQGYLAIDPEGKHTPRHKHTTAHRGPDQDIPCQLQPAHNALELLKLVRL